MQWLGRCVIYIFFVFLIVSSSFLFFFLLVVAYGISYVIRRIRDA